MVPQCGGLFKIGVQPAFPTRVDPGSAVDTKYLKAHQVNVTGQTSDSLTIEQTAPNADALTMANGLLRKRDIVRVMYSLTQVAELEGTFNEVVDNTANMDTNA